MTPVPAVAGLTVLATWNSWRWFGERIGAAPEEALSLALTVLLLGALALPRLKRGLPPTAVPLGPVSLLIWLHAAAEFAAPPILRAAIAATALLYVLFRAVFDRRPPPAFWGLVALSMPVLPSLQFVLGYPMRIASAILTVALLDLQGVPIAREGTYVVVGGETVQFDAPCSGVSMLWALVLITFVIGLVRCWPVLRLVPALLLTAAVAIMCNALRVASLLFAETVKSGTDFPWLHEGVGLLLIVLLRAEIFAGRRETSA